MDCNEILQRGPGWYNEELIKFCGDLGLLRFVNEQKNSIIVVACPDQDAGNDPKAFHHQSPTFTNAYLLVMICLGQGGLRSLSALSSFIFFTIIKVPYYRKLERGKWGGGGEGGGVLKFDGCVTCCSTLEQWISM